jgi:hypothetical protein
MNVGIGNEAAQFYFWKHINRIFGTGHCLGVKTLGSVHPVKLQNFGGSTFLLLIVHILYTHTCRSLDVRDSDYKAMNEDQLSRERLCSIAEPQFHRLELLLYLQFGIPDKPWRSPCSVLHRERFSSVTLNPI